MRLLLDESLPRRLRAHLPGHAVKTVVEMGWRGYKNGRLLAAAAADFDAFITRRGHCRSDRALRRGDPRPAHDTDRTLGVEFGGAARTPTKRCQPSWARRKPILQGIASTVRRGPALPTDPENPRDPEMSTLCAGPSRRRWQASLDGPVGPRTVERSFLALRIQLAHGGVTRRQAARLLQHWQAPFKALWQIEPEA